MHWFANGVTLLLESVLDELQFERSGGGLFVNVSNNLFWSECVFLPFWSLSVFEIFFFLEPGITFPSGIEGFSKMNPENLSLLLSGNAICDFKQLLILLMFASFVFSLFCWVLHNFTTFGLDNNGSDEVHMPLVLFCFPLGAVM